MNNAGKGPERFTCSFARADVDLFASPAGEKPSIRGYAAVFNLFSHDLGGFRTQISPNAFDNVLSSADVKLLVNHDSNALMGRTKSGTLKLSVDDRGLYFEGFPPETQYAAHVLESIRRGDMDGCSFSCLIAGDKWDLKGEMPTRTVLKIAELYDVGPVTDPAFPGTSVQASYALEVARNVETRRLEAVASRGRWMERLALLAQHDLDERT